MTIAERIAAKSEIAAKIAALEATGTDLYIRFGNIPARGRSRNHATGDTLDGISVYPALSVSCKYPNAYSTPLREVLAQMYEAYGYKAALVTGDHIGIGPDGEPLLRNLRLVTMLGLKPLTGVLVPHR